MICDITLPGFQEARFWIEDLPSSGLGSNIVQQHQFPALQEGKMFSGSIAVEWLLPAGAICRYGLIGAKFEVAEDIQLTVNVCGGAPEVTYVDSIVSSIFEEVKIGLPSQYANAVVAGVAACLNPQNTKSGKITIEAGAYGLVGSSEYIFQSLGRVFGELSKSSDVPSPEMIADLLRLISERS